MVSITANSMETFHLLTQRACNPKSGAIPLDLKIKRTYRFFQGF